MRSHFRPSPVRDIIQNKKSSDSPEHKQRASTCKQWQRKVDVEGSLCWYLSTTSNGSAKTQFTRYTVLFCHDTPPVDSPLVADTIRNECVSAKMELVESSKANPEFSPFRGLLDPIQNHQELVDLSTHRFRQNMRRPQRVALLRLRLRNLKCSGRQCSDLRFRTLHRTQDPRVHQNMQRDFLRSVSWSRAQAVGSSNHLAFCFAAGRLLGRGLPEGNLCGFHLSLPLLEIILGLSVSVEDLEYFDSELATEQMGDELVVVDLIRNGRDIAVSDDNKHEFIERQFRYTLFESVASQLYAFSKGIYEVVPQHLLFLFDAEELDCVLCGADEIDFNDWKCNSKYTSGLHEHPSFEAFLESRQRDAARVSKRLLHFAAGSSRVPLGGFGELTNYAGHQCPFALKAISFAETRIVRAHSCFNRSDLPLFATKKDVKDALYTVLDAEMYQHISNYTSSRQRGNEQEEPKEDKYD
ncbi:Hect ubiquitin ligase, partial [Globisporangium splendens]